MSDATALLDVNVLVALAWPTHVHHETAQAWFAKQSTWATTAATEAGFVRVSSNVAAIAYAVSPAAAISLLEQVAALPGHEFWTDDVANVVGDAVDPLLVVGHRQVSDAHLVAVALRHGGRLATLDRSVGHLAPHAPHAVEVITAD